MTYASVFFLTKRFHPLFGLPVFVVIWSALEARFGFVDGKDPLEPPASKELPVARFLKRNIITLLHGTCCQFCLHSSVIILTLNINIPVPKAQRQIYQQTDVRDVVGRQWKWTPAGVAGEVNEDEGRFDRLGSGLMLCVCVQLIARFMHNL